MGKMKRTRRFSGTKLKAARHEEDRSLEDVASALGVSRQTVHSWESGRTVPDATELALLAKVTDKPLDYFFEQVA